MNKNETLIENTLQVCDSSLIDQIKLAVDIEQLPTEFTTADIIEWMDNEHITKLDGTAYPTISHEQLTTYSTQTPITKKRKQKVLYCSLNGQLFSFNPF